MTKTATNKQKKSGSGAIRLAYLVTHPIQYQAPLLRRIAAHPAIDLTVFFCSDHSVRSFHDPGFGQEIKWDVPLLDGYAHDFLPAFGDRTRVTFWRPFSYGLFSRLRRGRFDALWVHGYARWPHMWAIACAKALGMKVFVRDEATLISTRRGKIKQIAKNVFFLGLRQLCDGVLAIGTLNGKYYAHHGFGEDRIHSMPYTVDNDFFRARADEAAMRRDALRAELGLDAGRPIILFASKLMERKRAKDLIDAHSMLIEDSSVETKPYLLIAGDGDMRPELESIVRMKNLESVSFLGFQTQRALPALYDLCDLFVLPSFYEPWGLVVNEAMNAGAAIVVSDQVGSGADLVRDGENGFVFPAGDVAALAEAIQNITQDSKRCADMGQRSRDIIGDWGFAQDIEGLLGALNLTPTKRIPSEHVQDAARQIPAPPAAN